MSTSKHSNPSFLTILLQDRIGGLQALCHNQWIDIPSVPETLVVNIGDLLLLIPNDKFISVNHRVLAKHERTDIISPTYILRTTPSMRLLQKSSSNEKTWSLICDLWEPMLHLRGYGGGCSDTRHGDITISKNKDTDTVSVEP